MELIRVKSRLAQPYAGAFLKKEDRYVTEYHCFHFNLHVIAKNNKRNLEISDVETSYAGLEINFCVQEPAGD